MAKYSEAYVVVDERTGLSPIMSEDVSVLKLAFIPCDKKAGDDVYLLFKNSLDGYRGAWGVWYKEIEDGFGYDRVFDKELVKELESHYDVLYQSNLRILEAIKLAKAELKWTIASGVSVMVAFLLLGIAFYLVITPGTYTLQLAYTHAPILLGSVISAGIGELFKRQSQKIHAKKEALYVNV